MLNAERQTLAEAAARRHATELTLFPEDAIVAEHSVIFHEAVIVLIRTGPAIPRFACVVVGTRVTDDDIPEEAYWRCVRTGVLKWQR